MGETVRYLPFACEWEEIPEAYKAHIFPTLESYFDLASWYNNQDKVVMGNNVYTVGDRKEVQKVGYEEHARSVLSRVISRTWTDQYILWMKSFRVQPPEHVGERAGSYRVVAQSIRTGSPQAIFQMHISREEM
ncbi:hypothetical protein Tco_0427294 [Tanacetum coccineum]